MTSCVSVDFEFLSIGIARNLCFFGIYQNAYHTALSKDYWINFWSLLAQFLHDINPSHTLLIFLFLTLAFQTFWFPCHQPKYSFFSQIFMLSSFLISFCFPSFAECFFLSCLNLLIAFLPFKPFVNQVIRYIFLNDI